MADEDMICHLRSWGLHHLEETFRENKITLPVLFMLTDADVERLIPCIGDCAVFKKNWKKFKEDSGSASPDKCQVQDISLLNISASDLVLLDQQTEINTNSDSDFTTSEQYEVVPRCTELLTEASTPVKGYDDLISLLQASNEGRGLLLKAGGRLNENERKVLTHIVARNILTQEASLDTPVRSSVYTKWSFDIRSLFTGEASSTYYMSACTRSDGGQIPPRGKLYNCVPQLRKKYKAAGLIKPTKRPSTEIITTTPKFSKKPYSRPIPEDFSWDAKNEEIEEHLTWLRGSSDPWFMVEDKWRLTTKPRIAELHADSGPTIKQYMEKYPALLNPSGIHLLEIDFLDLYPDKNSLFENLPTLKKKILTLAEEKKDPYLKKIIQEAEYSEEVANICAFLALAHMHGSTTVQYKPLPGKKSHVWRPSKQEIRDGFITHVTTAADVKVVMQERSEKFRLKNMTVQPNIIIVGPTLSSIDTYYVVVNQTLYPVNNITKTVDNCYKIHWALNCQYSQESSGVWYVIQRYLYGMHTSYDKLTTSASVILSELGIH